MTPQSSECHGKEIAVAFLQNFGGSKVKRDKGGMPDEPGNHQKRRQAKAFRRLKRCYDFEKCYELYAKVREKKDTAILFQVYQKCYQGKKA